ncbi:hypothetical protein [Eisenbergiella sp.]
MGWIYYMPEILFVIAAIIAVFGIISLVRSLSADKEGKILCRKCQAPAVKSASHAYLFLIPASFDQEYEDAEGYLSRNMKPIAGKDQIPTGRRACWLEVFTCTKCDERQVRIRDFLQVRGEEYLKGTYILPYASFRSLTEQWEEMDWNRERR